MLTSYKILVLTSSYPQHSHDPAGLFIQDFATALIKEGHEVTVLCPDSPEVKAIKNLPPRLTLHRFQYFFPRSLQKLAYGAGMPDNLSKSVLAKLQIPFFFVAQFFAALRLAKKHDLIHAHWAIPSGLTAACIQPLTRKKTILTLHSSDVWMLEKTQWGSRLLCWIMEHVSLVTTISKQLKNRVIQITEKTPVYAAPLGIETGRLKKRTSNPNHEEPRILMTLGRLIFLKGQTHVFSAIQGFRNIKIVLAGNGPEKENLQQRAHELGVEAQFLGNVVGEEKEKWLDRANIVLFPSIQTTEGRREGIPIALLESMARGKVIIASDSGAISEVMTHLHNGILVSPGNVAELRYWIEELFKNNELKERLEAQARISAQNYSWEKRVKPYLPLYKACLSP